MFKTLLLASVTALGVVAATQASAAVIDLTYV